MATAFPAKRPDSGLGADDRAGLIPSIFQQIVPALPVRLKADRALAADCRTKSVSASELTRGCAVINL